MTREIKFRGKVKHHNPMTNPENGWVEGYYLQDLIQGEMRSYIFQPPCSWEVIPDSVGQFTGLVDKNGDEICEGDVLAYTKYNWTRILLVEYKFGAFGYTYLDEFHALSGNPNFSFGTLGTDADFEIVGNIHDTPELLEGGAE